MIVYANSLGLDAMILNSAWKKNLKVRKNKDWEKMKGRAVCSDE